MAKTKTPAAGGRTTNKKLADKIKKSASKAVPSKEFTDLQNAQAWERGDSVKCARDTSDDQ